MDHTVGSDVVGVGVGVGVIVVIVVGITCGGGTECRARHGLQQSTGRGDDVSWRGGGGVGVD